MQKLINLLVLLLFCTNTMALCAWTEKNCEANNNTCYAQGTGNCRHYSCAFEQKPGGLVSLYDSDNEVVANENYDMSKSADDNCTAARRNLSW